MSVFFKLYNAILFFTLCTSRHKIGVRVRDATCRSLSASAQVHPQNVGSFFPVSTLFSPISLCFIAAIEVFSLKFVKWLNLPWLQEHFFVILTTALRLQISLFYSFTIIAEKKAIKTQQWRGKHQQCHANAHKRFGKRQIT